MRKVLTAILLALFAVCALCAFSCGGREGATDGEPQVSVGKVSRVELESGTLKWAKAENAENYKIEVYFNGTLKDTLSTVKYIQSVKKQFADVGSYTFKITAQKGELSGEAVEYNVESIRLETPVLTLSQDGTRYTWEEIDNATRYHVTDRISVDEENYEINYIDELKTDDTAYTFYYPINPGRHEISVRAVGSFDGEIVYLESVESLKHTDIEIEKYAYFTVGTNGTKIESYGHISTDFGQENAGKTVKFLFRTEDRWGNPVEGKGNWGRRLSAGNTQYWFVEKDITCDDREWTRGSLPTNEWIECYGKLNGNGDMDIWFIDFAVDEYFAIKDLEIVEDVYILSVKQKDGTIDEKTGEYVEPSSWDTDFFDIYGAEQTTEIETGFSANATVTVNVRFMEKSYTPLLGEGPLDKDGNPTLRFYTIGGVSKFFTERLDIEDKEQMPYTMDFVTIECTLNEQGKLEVTWGGMHIYEYIIIKDITLVS